MSSEEVKKIQAPLVAIDCNIGTPKREILEYIQYAREDWQVFTLKKLNHRLTKAVKEDPDTFRFAYLVGRTAYKEELLYDAYLNTLNGYLSVIDGTDYLDDLIYFNLLKIPSQRRTIRTLRKLIRRGRKEDYPHYDLIVYLRTDPEENYKRSTRLRLVKRNPLIWEPFKEAFIGIHKGLEALYGKQKRIDRLMDDESTTVITIEYSKLKGQKKKLDVAKFIVWAIDSLVNKGEFLDPMRLGLYELDYLAYHSKPHKAAAGVGHTAIRDVSRKYQKLVVDVRERQKKRRQEG